MADISKCWGDGCTIKEKCFRFTAQPHGRQSWMNFKQNADGTCDDQIEVISKSQTKRLNAMTGRKDDQR